jgi:hypothetical protein
MDIRSLHKEGHSIKEIARKTSANAKACARTSGECKAKKAGAKATTSSETRDEQTTNHRVWDAGSRTGAEEDHSFGGYRREVSIMS